ncbi:MAG TPA: PLP-dependent aminotransferase family protein [Thermoanaerobaculia bacterium]|nr:PLP-dependent aminotransferase family protein [Thermoanaerobaculia bacterium]
MTAAERFLSRDAASFRPSAIRAFARLINDPGVISFAGGVPNPDTFPAERIADIAADVLVTTGSQQALDLVAHALLDPGDVVLVELPTYIGGTASFYARSARLEGVAQDDGGIVIESLAAAAAKRPKLVYTIPNFQNPSGRLMTQQRRAGVLALAEKYDFLVIEDDPYGELVYVDGADTTPMKAGDDSGRVIYLGSFSKVLAPGLRCGWIVAPPWLSSRLEIAKQAADLCSGMLDQSMVDEFIAAGELPHQIAKVRDFYRGKRGVLIAALEEHFAGRATWTAADGGRQGIR